MSTFVPTGIASIQWQNNGTHIRVYFQHTDGFIYEAAYDGNGWTPAGSLVKIAQAKPHTPIAAVVWDTAASHPPQIRVYYIDNNNAIKEHVYSNGWQAGATLPAPNVSVISKLGAVSWSNQPEIRVYYQKQDNTIQEIVWSKGWSVGAHFDNVAFPGTSISATKLDDSASLRVYYQSYDLTLHELVWSGKWTDQQLKTALNPGGGISAVGWTDTGNAAHLRVYLGNTPVGSNISGAFVIELNYNAGTGWIYPPGQPTNTITRFDQPLSAIQWGNSTVQIRVYTQQESADKITELVWNGSSWSAQTLPF